MTLTACGGGGGGGGGSAAGPGVDPNDLDGDGFNNTLDMDDDGDGLIEITSATQLNAMRYNLRGTGLDMDNIDNDNTTGGNFTGCPTTNCTGYELMANVDLNKLVDNATSGHNWDPIGRCNGSMCDNTNQHFSGIFNGNDYNISNMRINIMDAGADNLNQVFGFGFFGAVAANTQLSNIHIRQGYIMQDTAGFFSAGVGGLVGRAGADVSITGSSVILDKIIAHQQVGGLVGIASDNLQISYSYVMLRKLQIDTGYGGGLVGDLGVTMITSSYAIVDEIEGSVLGQVGGLVGIHSDSEKFRMSSSFAVFANMSVPDSTSSTYGGLVGLSDSGLTMESSYGVFNQIVGDNLAGGLVTVGNGATITASYVLANQIMTLSSNSANGGLVGATTINNAPNEHLTSYYNIPNINNPSLTATGAPFGVSYTRAELSTPTDFVSPSIYETWANGHCNPTTGEYMEVEPATPPPDFVSAWNLNDADNDGDEYPALNCLPDFTPAQQRAAIDLALQGLSPISAHPEAAAVRQ